MEKRFRVVVMLQEYREEGIGDVSQWSNEGHAVLFEAVDIVVAQRVFESLLSRRK